MDVRLPDGTVIQNVPDGTSKTDLIGKLQRNGYDTSALVQAESGKMALEGMSGVEKFAAGAGKAASDLYEGGKQLFSLGHAGMNKEEVEAMRRRDSALMESGAGAAGNIAGNVAAAVPTAFIPGINTYTGAALAGSAFGALQPATSAGERVMNTGVGAGLGVAGQGLSNAVGRVIRPIQSSLNPEGQRLAQVAQREGIPLDLAQRTGSKPLQTVNSVMESLPFTAGPEAAKRGAQQTAFNRAVLSKAGASADLATPEVLLNQRGTLGKTFEDIAGRNTLTIEPWIKEELGAIGGEASRRLSNPQAVLNTVNDILRDAPGGVMQGPKYQGWRETLGRLSKSGGSEGHYFGELKKLLDSTFNAQVSGADAALWQEASRQYGALKTIADAMGGAGTTPNIGNISPAQLSSSVAKSFGREGKALGRGELNDLARVGQAFVKEQIPNSGTQQRLFYQKLMTGAAPALIGGGIGGGYGYLTGQDPLKTAALGTAALYSPRVLQMAINNPMVARYLASGITNPKAVALANAIRALPVPASMALTANASQQ